MSSAPTLGRYHFQAWARRGIAASLNTPDGGSLPSRANLSVQLFLDVQGGTAPNPVLPPATPVSLFGPGDVVGVDPRMVIRTEPRQFTVNFEPNYLSAIEFDTPDFPWLFTPAAPHGDRLRPWVALIVLKTSEFTVPSVAPNPLPTIVVQTMSALQDLSVSWNWAHVQISGDASLSDTLTSAPGNVISRLLCPRRLDPETSYSAFLVPAFQNGVLAGLGQDVSGVTTSDPAWTSDTQAPLTLPFYFRFDFNTSDEGDFESLVRQLTPRILPATVGQRMMDVQHPDPGVPSAGGPLGLDGALESVSTTDTQWTGADKDAFQTALQNWINQTAPATDDPANPHTYPPPGDPVVVPPIYGRWPAAVTSVNRAAAGWVNDLSLDPRNRSAAGMGTQVVQGEQTQLMASAWQQVEGVLQANQLLTEAQLARAVSQQIYRQHLQTAQPETVLNFTAPLHSRLLASPTTVTAKIRASRVPPRIFSGAFRKAARLPWRLGMAKNGAPTLLTRVNSGAVAIVPPIQPPAGMVSIDQLSNQSAPTWAEDLLKWKKWILIAAMIVIAAVVVVAGLAGGWAAALVAAVACAAAAAAAWNALKNSIAGATAASSLQPSSFTPALVAQVPARPNFQITTPGTAASTASSGSADSAPAAAFRAATSQVFAEYQLLPNNPAPLPALDIATLKTTILTRIDPVTTIPARVQGLLTISEHLPWQPVDPLETIMAAPDFPQPMYAPLRDLSQEYLLPGVEQIPADTVGLLQSNPSFIEAYMVGLNSEMGRDLLWFGYPTDQRGSYFRQFWDVSAYVPQPGDPTDPAQLEEMLKDIPPINTWSLTSALGQHPNRPGIVKNNLVLLVRGELFKRYPNAIVYAGKATRLPNGTRVLDNTDERYPLFRGTLSPDMTFLGFNLTAADARGGTTTSPDGFFFVFQEQPSEPRFGLEPTPDISPVRHWADLAWTNFGPATATLPPPAPTAPSSGNSRAAILAHNPWRLASQVFANVLQSTTIPNFLTPLQQPTGIAIVSDSNNPDDTNNQWGVNSAQTAYILLRLPFRVLIHADLMLPSS
jgi:hypothetical protein